MGYRYDFAFSTLPHPQNTHTSSLPLHTRQGKFHSSTWSGFKQRFFCWTGMSGHPCAALKLMVGVSGTGSQLIAWLTELGWRKDCWADGLQNLLCNGTRWERVGFLPNSCCCQSMSWEEADGHRTAVEIGNLTWWRKSHGGELFSYSLQLTRASLASELC